MIAAFLPLLMLMNGRAHAAFGGDAGARPSGLVYELHFTLDESAPRFEGEEDLRFKLGAKPSQDLALDFVGGEIRSLAVNGKPVAKPSYDGKTLELDHALLARGGNRIEIRFAHEYASGSDEGGDGLHRLRDAADGAVYVYPQNEPRGARRIFPCLDRPEMKAKFRLTVRAPRDWKVIANAREAKVAGAGAASAWSFAESPRLSTYLFALYAGPFAEWSDRAGHVPLRLFAPRSKKDALDAHRWFSTTKEGLRFYAKWFDRAYPFGKYDQVIVPRTDSWATEYAGAALFTLHPQAETRAAILHELAHSWVGDLVTPRDWDAQWLKEALAVVISAEVAGSWDDFARTKVSSAYELDSKPGARPLGSIFDPGSDSDSSVFSLLGLAKGAAVLKQLQFSLGAKAFQNGVRAVIREHAFGNVTVGEFLATLSREAHRPLERWRKQWVETAGANSLHAVWDCDRAGRLKSFTLLQGGTPLREHRIRIAFQGASGGHYDVEYSAERTEVQGARGAWCPKSVLLNDGELDYVQVR